MGYAQPGDKSVFGHLCRSDDLLAEPQGDLAHPAIRLTCRVCGAKGIGVLRHPDAPINNYVTVKHVDGVPVAPHPGGPHRLGGGSGARG
jgi:hypothetical protein